MDEKDKELLSALCSLGNLPNAFPDTEKIEIYLNTLRGSGPQRVLLMLQRHLQVQRSVRITSRSGV